PLHGRRVGGWVVGLGASAADGVALKPIAKVSGWGPPPEVVELAQWAAWRWAGPVTTFLGAASPPVAVGGLPPARTGAPVPAPLDPRLAAAFDSPCTVVRHPPAADPLAVALAAAGRGNALVVTPSVAAARLLATRLRRAG